MSELNTIHPMQSPPSYLVDMPMPSYFLHSPQIWLLAREARDRAKSVTAQNPDASAVDAIVAIILAASAAEAFINEVSEMCIPHRPDCHLSSSLLAFGKQLNDMEQDRASTLNKYVTASTALSGKPFVRGKRPFQDFDLLFKARDTLMHVKAIDQSGPRKGETATFTMPKLVKRLQSKKLAKPSKDDVGSSWFDALQTDRVAAWACDTALTMIHAVLDMIPDAHGDPTEAFKRQFRSFKALT